MGNYYYAINNESDTEVSLTIENTDKCDGPVTIWLSPADSRKLAVQLLQGAQSVEDNARRSK